MYVCSYYKLFSSMNGKRHGYVANAIKLINNNWSAARELNVNEKKELE